MGAIDIDIFVKKIHVVADCNTVFNIIKQRERCSDFQLTKTPMSFPCFCDAPEEKWPRDIEGALYIEQVPPTSYVFEQILPITKTVGIILKFCAASLFGV